MRFRSISFLSAFIFAVACISTPKDNEIWYYTEDSLLEEIKVENCDILIVSHGMIKGKGIIKFKKPITSIADGAFANCDRLTKILLPKTITRVGDYYFTAYSKLEERPLTASIHEIGSGAFSDCISLKSLTITEGIKMIGEGTFKGCTSLIQVTVQK